MGVGIWWSCSLNCSILFFYFGIDIIDFSGVILLLDFCLCFNFLFNISYIVGNFGCEYEKGFGCDLKVEVVFFLFLYLKWFWLVFLFDMGSVNRLFFLVLV